MSNSTSILLHVCCADCLLRFLAGIGFSLPPSCQELINFDQNFTTTISNSSPTFTLFFYNPNLYPQSEFNARRQAVDHLAKLLNFPLIIADYQPQDFFNLPPCQAQLNNSQLNLNRCSSCQNLRLEKTFTYFQVANQLAHKFDQFSTTMLASPYLNHQQIATLGCSLSPHFFTPKLNPSTTDNLRTTGFFKQNYCGCLFSLIQKTKNKYLTDKPLT